MKNLKSLCKFILLFYLCINVNILNSQSYIDTILYSHGSTLYDNPSDQQFNFKFNNDTLISWGRVTSYCGDKHYFIVEIINDTIIIDRYTPVTADCFGTFVFFARIPNCNLDSYKFILNESYLGSNDGFDTIIDINISSSVEYIDTILYATSLFSGNPENQLLNVTFENDTITFSGKIAASYNASISNHYFITEIRNNIILLDRYDLNVTEGTGGLYDFSIKIPDCTLNTYNFILRPLYISGFDTIITQTTSINELKKNNYNIRYYPNPSNSDIIIELSEKYSYNLIIRDINGKIVKKLNINKSNSVKIKKTGLKPGLFIFQLFRNDGYYLSKKIIIN